MRHIWRSPRCFRVTNLQRPPFDLLTAPGLLGNDDPDGLTADSPSGHLEQLSRRLIEKQKHHRRRIDSFFFFPCCIYRESILFFFLRLPPVGSFSVVLPLTFDLGGSAAGGHCQCLPPPHTHTLQSPHRHTHTYIPSFKLLRVFSVEMNSK